MSTAKFDQWALSNGSAVQTLVNFERWNVTAISTANYYDANSLGSASGYGSAPTPTAGTTFAVLPGFTPKFSDSTLIFRTSMISISEIANVGDDYRIFAHAENTLIGWQRAASNYQAFSSGWNSATMFIHSVIPSWGTQMRNIRIGIDGTGSVGSYYQINGRYSSNHAQAPFYATIMEYR